MLRALAVLITCAALAGCVSPAASVALALIPDGTFATLLSNLQGVETPNQDRLAKLASESDWDGIAHFSEQNIAADATNSDWWLIGGYARTQLHQFERARSMFAEAVRLTPDNMDAWHLLAQSYRALGQPERAVRTLDNALRVSQVWPMTYFLLGESFRDLKRTTQAIEYYEQAVQRDAQFVEAWYALGQVYWQSGRTADYKQVIEVLRRLDTGAAERLAQPDIPTAR